MELCGTCLTKHRFVGDAWSRAELCLGRLSYFCFSEGRTEKALSWDVCLFGLHHDPV